VTRFFDFAFRFAFRFAFGRTLSGSFLLPVSTFHRS